jgi:hypothetical protein
MSSRNALALVLGCALVAVAAASEAQAPSKERKRRRYERPPQMLTQTTAKAEQPGRAWRLRFKGWSDGTLLLGSDEGEASLEVGGDELKAEPDARALLLHDRTGHFMTYVEGAGDGMGHLILLAHELQSLPLTEAGVAQVLEDGAELLLDDGRRYEVSAEDRAAAAALAGQNAGASVVAEQEIAIWGLPGPGPLLDVKRLP